MTRGQRSGRKRSKCTAKEEVMATSPATSSLRVLSHKRRASSEAGSPSSSSKRKRVSFTLCDATISPLISQSQGSPSNPLAPPLSSTEAKPPTLIHKPQACPVAGPSTIPKKSAKEIGDAAENIVWTKENLPNYKPTDRVPAPKLEGVPLPSAGSNTPRSAKSRMAGSERGAKFRAKHARKSSDHFVVPISLSDLKKVNKSSTIKPKLQKICLDLQDRLDPQCKTGQFYDKDMNLLAVYLGIRVVGDKEQAEGGLKDEGQVDSSSKGKKKAPEKDRLGRDDYEKAVIHLTGKYEEQYVGRTRKDVEAEMKSNPNLKIVEDGLSDIMLMPYVLYTQKLANVIQPVQSLSDPRHRVGSNTTNPRVMEYSRELNVDMEAESKKWDEEVEEMSTLMETRDLAQALERVRIEEGKREEKKHSSSKPRSQDNETSIEEESGTGTAGGQDSETSDEEVGTGAPYTTKHQERCGVMHLVQGWIQQGQKKKGLFLSSEVTKSGAGLASLAAYYDRTQPIAEALAAMFAEFYPEEYVKYKEAFDAGVWIQEDPGPWLGRVIVYKLHVALHADKHDDGPTACFPAGYFEGGNMQVPQTRSLFEYSPGHVCLFLSGDIFHAISDWSPKTMGPNDQITPGRIGSVFFFPRESLAQLQGKPKNWARDTAYGTWEPREK